MREPFMVRPASRLELPRLQEFKFAVDRCQRSWLASETTVQSLTFNYSVIYIDSRHASYSVMLMISFLAF